jgi:hypothetical protein
MATPQTSALGNTGTGANPGATAGTGQQDMLDKVRTLLPLLSDLSSTFAYMSCFGDTTGCRYGNEEGRTRYQRFHH